MTAPTVHTLPYRHLIGAHLLVPCSNCGGELQRVLVGNWSKHIVCRNCHRDYGQDTTEMLVEGGRG